MMHELTQINDSLLRTALVNSCALFKLLAIFIFCVSVTAKAVQVKKKKSIEATLKAREEKRRKELAEKKNNAQVNNNSNVIPATLHRLSLDFAQILHRPDRLSSEVFPLTLRQFDSLAPP